MAAFKSDHMIIRDYVTAQDHLQYQQLAEGVVAILLTHSNLEAKHLDVRVPTFYPIVVTYLCLCDWLQIQYIDSIGSSHDGTFQWKIKTLRCLCILFIIRLKP